MSKTSQTVSWKVLPLHTRDIDFFERQRNLFSTWLGKFDEDWKNMRYKDSQNRFEHQLENIKRDMHKLDSENDHIYVPQPFVTDPTGNRKMSLRFDCHQFKPEEITVKTRDNVLCVHAKHVDETPNRKKFIELTKTYTLPDNVDPLKVKSTLSRDGVLAIEAPAPSAVMAPKEYLIPVDHL